MTYVSQTIMLHTLNLYSTVCQLYINKTGRKKLPATLGSGEPRGRTGIKTQMRMDLRTWGGGRVSWDEVREWHGHIYTTKCKIDS